MIYMYVINLLWYWEVRTSVRGFPCRHGRTKNKVPVHIGIYWVGDRSWVQEERSDGANNQELTNLQESDLEEFEEEFKQIPSFFGHGSQPIARAEPTLEASKPTWNPEWDPLVHELKEFGFSDVDSSKAAIAKTQGDLKAAVKELVAAERQ